ncbi:MAG: hypothetical protein KF859_03465 [Phycisphaeraceae bacterium]|nr:hypothetical protein [Phycisphaeraceae bacterium]
MRSRNQLTLWNLLGPIADALGISRRAKPPARKAKIAPRPRSEPAPPARKTVAGAPAKGARADAQARYDAMTRRMLDHYGVRVRRWRTNMSGIAWELTYADGSRSRLIESPKPRGPMSAAIFLHEIGHHAIGFNVYKPRCLEEYHAWMFSLEQMRKEGLNITESVHRRVDRSLRYAVAKARRRGIKAIPTELKPYL